MNNIPITKTVSEQQHKIQCIKDLHAETFVKIP